MRSLSDETSGLIRSLRELPRGRRLTVQAIELVEAIERSGEIAAVIGLVACLPRAPRDAQR